MAVALLVMAVVADLAAKVIFSDAAARMAITRISVHKPNSAANRHLDAGQIWVIVSYCCAALGIACWITSTIRGERCHHAIPIIFLFIFLLVQFVFV